MQFRHNTVDMQDKLTYNAEAKTLLLTDLGFTDFAAQPSADTALSLVMLNGVVRKTTDSKIAVSNVTDIYYASQPRRLFVLSGQELLELDDSGNVASRLNLEAQVERPVGLTFAPDGGKFMVLGADGQVHIFSSQVQTPARARVLRCMQVADTGHGTSHSEAAGQSMQSSDTGTGWHVCLGSLYSWRRGG